MKTFVYIDGMICTECAKRIEAKLSTIRGVTSVKARHKRKLAIIRSRFGVNAKEVKKMVEDLDYTVIEIENR